MFQGANEAKKLWAQPRWATNANKINGFQPETSTENLLRICNSLWVQRMTLEEAIMSTRNIMVWCSYVVAALFLLVLSCLAFEPPQICCQHLSAPLTMVVYLVPSSLALQDHSAWQNQALFPLNDVACIPAYHHIPFKTRVLKDWSKYQL